MLAAIDREQLRFDDTGYGAYRRLDRLVRVVPPLLGDAADPALGARVDRLIEYVRRNAAQPMVPDRGGGLYWTPEEDHRDVNHALAWLLKQMSPKAAATAYDRRLTALRDAATGPCRAEVQLALDATRIEDNVELADVLLRHALRHTARAAVRPPTPDPPATRPTLADKVDSYFVRPTVVAAFFSPDGGAVRTIGPDPAVRRWDGRTLAAIDVMPLPAGTAVGAVRPTDGRYVLCPDAQCFADRRTDAPDPPATVKVLDADAGKVVGIFPLAVHWRYGATAFLWPGGTDVVCVDDGTLRRFDLRSGVVSETVKVDFEHDNALFNGLALLAEDGRTVFSPEAGGKQAVGKLTHYDLTDHQTSSPQPLQLPAYDDGYVQGLVPDGRQFYLAGPNVMLFDRRTAEPTLVRMFRGTELMAIAFSNDGRRFAVATREANGDPARRWPRAGAAVLRVHDSATGRTLFAADLPDGEVRGLRFSPDGGRVAVSATLRLPGATHPVVDLYAVPG